MAILVFICVRLQPEKVLKRLTDVNADVEMVGQDDKFVYYTSAEVSPVDNHLFRVEVKAERKPV